MDEAPELLEMPEVECPVIRTRLLGLRCPKSWETIVDTVIPPQCNLHGHPLAGRGTMGNNSWMGVYMFQRKLGLFSSV